MLQFPWIKLVFFLSKSFNICWIFPIQPGSKEFSCSNLPPTHDELQCMGPKGEDGMEHGFGMLGCWWREVQYGYVFLQLGDSPQLPKCFFLQQTSGIFKEEDLGSKSGLV